MIKAAILTIGDEILIGQIIDTNSSWLGQQLTGCGIQVTERHSVGDIEAQVEEVLSYLNDKVDLVVCTGGLGPTRDDKTKIAICSFFDCQLVFNEENYAWMEDLFARWNKKPGESHRNQAYLPDKAQILHNAMGTAPGLLLRKNTTRYLFTPGVPYEMKSIVSEELMPLLSTWFEVPPIVHTTLLTAGMGETDIESRITDIEDQLPADISLAYLPSRGTVRLRVMMKGNAANEEEVQKWTNKIAERLGPGVVFGKNDTSLVQVVGELLQERGMKLTLAESCTGGYIAHQITSLSGSSKFYHGGVVSYSNELKISELGVDPEAIKDHGAVSEVVVRQMAKGAVERYQGDIALSVSGIAGPTGGSEQKPVGTVWMSVSDGVKTWAKCYRFGKTRQLNIQYAGVYGLNMIRKFLLGIELQ